VRAQGLGLMLYDLGCKVWGPGLSVRVPRCRVHRGVSCEGGAG
jgi:hypothetical protein